ncbi:MAG: serine/threonine-protein kinase [Polyangiaceae bacterium]
MATSVQNESKIPVGTILVGKYKVSREIGRGGMAAVYEAEHLSLSKRVAIKVLAAELTASKIVSERFFREARAAASVKSPHIVEVYDSGRLEDGRPFIVMELLEGESLYDLMARVRIIDNATTTKIITDCAKGLLKAHAIGIVHRDLKPENIFILKAEDGTEYSKILDFGLAKFYAPLGDEGKAARLTREGAVFGTPAYMSPEQVKGLGNVDHRADLWALGCMAYECLTGRPVWNTEQGVAMTFAAIATAPFPVPSKVYPGIPTSFDTWFQKALERDPAKRFQSAKELAESLAVALGARSSSPELRISGREMASVDDGGPPSSETLLLPGGPRPPPPSSSPSGRELVPPSVPAANQSGQLPLMPPSNADILLRESSNGIASVRNVPTSTTRLALGAGLMVLSFAGAAIAWARYLSPQVATPIVEAPPTTASASNSAQTAPPQIEELKWARILAEGQRLLYGGDLSGAQKKFKEAQKEGGGAAAQTVSDQVKAAADGRGSCKLLSITHPRLGVTGNAGRPAILSQPKGALVAWTDDHEQPGHYHVYGALIDEAGVVVSPPRDLSPEAGNAWRPVLLPAGDKTALFYWDREGKEAGIRGRLLDAEGRIESGAGGESVLIGGSKASEWPSFYPTPAGYVAVWQDSRDGTEDIFLRRLNNKLELDGGEIRLTDYTAAVKKTGAGAKVPVVAVAADALLVAYRLDRGATQSIARLRIPLASPELVKGLDEGTDPKRGDRVVGDFRPVSDDKSDVPAIACGTEGCFLAWHHEQPTGALVGIIDATEGKMRWHKQIVTGSGGRPALASNAQGDVAIAFFEQGKLKIAPTSRDGIGVRSVFARSILTESRPYLTPAQKRGEWYVGWLDSEAGHAEALVARILCAR